MNENENLENQEKPVDTSVAKLVSRFNASEKLMREDFLPFYELANARVRAELDIKGRGTRKLTHEQVAITYSIGSNFVNSVYFKSPNVNLTAREEVQHEAVENTEIAVNDWLQDKKVKSVIKRVIWDAYKGGFGAVFIDYVYDDVEDQSNILVPEVIDPVTSQVIQPPQFGRTVLRNEITIQRIRPDLVRFPRGFDFDNYQDSPWIGFDVILPIDEVKSNPKWNPNVTALIEGERFEKLSDSTKKNSNQKPGSDSSDLYAKISYEFKKPENSLEPYTLTVFCHKYDEAPLEVIEFQKGHVGYPIHFIYFNPLDDDCPYPKGDAWMFESQLNAVDEWWKKVFRHIRRSNPKFVYDKSGVTEQEAGKLKSNNDNEFVGLQNKANKDLRALVQELNASPVPQDLDKLWEVARQLISEIAPKSSLSGGAGKTSDSATEAKIMATGEMIDIDARIDDVKEFIKKIVLDVAGIMANALASPLSVRRENPMLEADPMAPKFIFDQVGSEGFTDKISVDVEVESMQAQNKDVVRRQLLDMLGLFERLAPFFQAIGKMPDPKWWIERIMETSSIRNIDKGFVDMAPAPIDPNNPQQVGPQGATAPNMETNASDQMPPEAVEAGLAQRV